MKRTQPIPASVFVFSLAALAAILPACDSAPMPGSSSVPGQTGESVLRNGSFAFRFDPAEVRELEILHQMPESGAPYSARLKRGPDERGTPHWEITSDSRPMTDRLADSSFVAHLIDTLRTLQIAQAPPETPKGPLASFGLDQPRFALRWKDGRNTYEVRLGKDRPKDGSSYALFPGLDRFGLGDGAAVYSVKGAALEMLDRVRSFDSLRLRNLSPLRTDEVASIELRRQGRSVLRARRGGPGWKSDWVDRITHLKIRTFIDDAAEASALRRRVLAEPAFEAVLSPGKGDPVSLQVALLDGRAVAAVSSRPEAAFILDPMALRYFESP